MTDKWFKQDHSNAELDQRRSDTLELLKERYGYKGVITCEDCDMKRKCEFSYDAYNTDGDCLMDK